MEKKEETINVSQKAILVDESGKILAIRRTETAPSNPLHWDLPGGDLEAGGELTAEIAREIREETGLEARDLNVIDAAGGFNDRKEFWITICYAARPASKEVVLSYEHDDFRWVTPDEFLKLKISPRIQRFIERFKFLRAESRKK